jgi:hypothetical protein
MKTLEIYAELNARIPNAVRRSLVDVTYEQVQDILIPLVKIRKSIFLLQKVPKHNGRGEILVFQLITAGSLLEMQYWNFITQLAIMQL